MAPAPAMLRRDSTTMWEADSELSMRESCYGDDILLPTALEDLQGHPGLVCHITGHSKQDDGSVVYHIVTEYVNRIGDADTPSRPVAQTQQRYSAFRTMHLQCRKALKVHFKVAPHILRDQDWVKEERVIKLAEYLNDCLRSAQARDMEPPEALRAFLGIEQLDLDHLHPLPEVGRCPSTAAALTARAATLLEKMPSAADLKTKAGQVVVSGREATTARAATLLEKMPSAADLKTKAGQVVVSGREATTSLSTAWPAVRSPAAVRVALGALLVLLLAVAWSQSQPPVPAPQSHTTTVTPMPQAILLAQGARVAAARAAIAELGQRLRGDLGPKLNGIVHAAEGGVKRGVTSGVQSAKGGIKAAYGGVKSTIDAAKARLHPHVPAATS